MRASWIGFLALAALPVQAMAVETGSGTVANSTTVQSTTTNSSSGARASKGANTPTGAVNAPVNHNATYGVGSSSPPDDSDAASERPTDNSSGTEATDRADTSTGLDAGDQRPATNVRGDVRNTRSSGQ